MTVKFTVDGKVRGKSRPRYSAKTRRMYTPSATSDYETDIQLAYIRSIKRNNGINTEFGKSGVEMQIDMWIYGKTTDTPKPDIDNVIKIVCDALNGVAYDDDKQILKLIAYKHTVRNHDEEKITVSISGEQKQ